MTNREDRILATWVGIVAAGALAVVVPMVIIALAVLWKLAHGAWQWAGGFCAA